MSVGHLEAVPQPIAADGKPFVLPNIFPGEVLLNFTGCSDELGPPIHRFEGSLFSLSKEGTGTETFTIDFADGIFLAGGHIEWEGGSPGSRIDFLLTAPATTVADANGAGNCNLYSIGQGINLIVPAAGDGAKNLVSPVPIPASNDETNAPEGHWDYSEPWVGHGTMTPSATPTAKYNLLDFPVELAHFCTIHAMRDTGARDMIAPAIKPKWILPEWKMKVSITNADANKTFRLSWDLLVARRKSV